MDGTQIGTHQIDQLFGDIQIDFKNKYLFHIGLYTNNAVFLI